MKARKQYKELKEDVARHSRGNLEDREGNAFNNNN
jgi:hypothetical protein